MKIIKYIFLFIFCFLLCNCETEVEFKSPISKEENFVLTVLASTDTIMHGYATRILDYSEAINSGSYSRYPFLWSLGQFGGWYPLEEKFCLIDADIKYSVNGSPYKSMSYDIVSHCYMSDYKPMPGDHVHLNGMATGMKTIEAEAVIPSLQQVEVLSWEKKPLPEHYVSINDTVVNLRLRMHDDPKQRDYYRLKVRSIYDNHNSIRATDQFSSDDPIFRDDRIKKDFQGWWPAGFLNVFTDDAFVDGEYEVDLSIPMMGQKTDIPQYAVNINYLEIELQSLTRDMYEYLKSFRYFMDTNPDVGSEPAHIYSNVSNRLGIFGAMATERQYVLLTYSICEEKKSVD